MGASESYNEQELLKRVADGDEQAFATLVKSHAPRLHGYIYNLTRRADDAQDIVQEVFVDIWAGRSSLRGIRNFDSFIRVVTRNKTISAMRRMIKERAQREEWIWTQKDSPDEIEGERLDLIEEAIAHLSPQQQKIWVMTRKEGKSYQQVADELNISRETVKKHLQYANASIFNFVNQRVTPFIIAYIFSK